MGRPTLDADSRKARLLRLNRSQAETIAAPALSTAPPHDTQNAEFRASSLSPVTSRAPAPLRPSSPASLHGSLASLSSSLRARQSSILTRLSSLSQSHSTCRTQLTQALSSYVQRSHSALKRSADRVGALLDAAEQLERQMHDSDARDDDVRQRLQEEARALEQRAEEEARKAASLERFDPFAVECVRALEEERERLKDQAEEARAVQRRQKAELEGEFDRLRARYEQLERQMADTLAAVEQQSAERDHAERVTRQSTSAARPLSRFDDEVVTLLLGKDSQLETLRAEVEQLRVERDAGSGDGERRVAAMTREKEEALRRLSVVNEDREQLQREADRLRKAESERERQRISHSAEDERRQKERTEQRRHEERAAAQREAERLLELRERERRESDAERMRAALAELERERKEALRDKRDLLARLDRVDEERLSIAAEHESERKRWMEREAALLKDTRRERQRLDEDLNAHAQHRIRGFIDQHTHSVQAVLITLDQLIDDAEPDAANDEEQQRDDDSADSTDASAIRGFERATQRLQRRLSRAVASMQERVETARRRGDEEAVRVGERLTERLAVLIESQAKERHQRAVEERERAATARLQHEEELRTLKDAAAQDRAQAEREVVRLRAEREKERAEWEDERALLDQRRREDVHSAMLLVHAEWREKEDERRRALEAQVEAALAERKRVLDQDTQQRRRKERNDAAEREQRWQEERRALLEVVERRRREEETRLATLSEEVQRWKGLIQEREERASADVRTARKQREEDVRRTRRAAVEQHDALAAALIESRAEVARVSGGKDDERLEVDVLHRRLKDAEEQRRASADALDALRTEAERRAREVERQWREEVAALKARWAREREEERAKREREQQSQRQREQREWEARLRDREDALRAETEKAERAAVAVAHATVTAPQEREPRRRAEGPAREEESRRESAAAAAVVSSALEAVRRGSALRTESTSRAGNDVVYDDGDSDDDAAIDAAVQPRPARAFTLAPPPASTASPPRTASGRSQSVSVLAGLAPSPFTQQLLSRLQTSTRPSSPSKLTPAALSSAALYWRQSVSDSTEPSSTSATRASTPGISGLPSPDQRRSFPFPSSSGTLEEEPEDDTD